MGGRMQGSSMQRFGEKLRTLRKRRGMTIKELAQAIGQTTHSHISELETGKRPPSLEIALKISRMFSVSIDKLVKDELELDWLYEKFRDKAESQIHWRIL